MSKSKNALHYAYACSCNRITSSRSLFAVTFSLFISHFDALLLKIVFETLMTLRNDSRNTSPPPSPTVATS